MVVGVAGAWVPVLGLHRRHHNGSYSPGSDYHWVGMKVFQVDDTDRGFIMSLMFRWLLW